MINSKIKQLKKSLTQVTQTREVQRKRRKNVSSLIFSLVGYTNSGKSTRVRSKLFLISSATLLLINNGDFGILILIIFSKTMDAFNADTRLLVSEEREIKFFWLKISF